MRVCVSNHSSAWIEDTDQNRDLKHLASKSGARALGTSSPWLECGRTTFTHAGAVEDLLFALWCVGLRRGPHEAPVLSLVGLFGLISSFTLILFEPSWTK